MTVRFKHLLVEPKGPGGWTSGRLEFGEFLTILFGANGSGKTPLMKAIAFGLGHDVELTSALREHSEAVRLAIDKAGVEYEIRRLISETFDIAVKSAQDSKRFLDEKTYSAWFLEFFGISRRTFTGINGGGVVPYVPLIMPLFFIDQDNGWRVTHAAVRGKNYVKDQEEEVLRLVLALPTRHPFEAREELQRAERDLKAIDVQIDGMRQAIEQMQEQVGRDAHKRIDRLERAAQSLADRLAEKNSAVEAIRSAGSDFDTEIEQAIEHANATAEQIATVQGHIERFERASKQIDAEVEILSANEIAAEGFRQLCGNPACQFFRPSETSYGRRLLFLKDQIKDLHGTSGALAIESTRLQTELSEQRSRITAVENQKVQSLGRSGFDVVVAELNMLTSSYAEARFKVERSHQLIARRTELEKLIDRRSELLARIKALKPRRAGKDEAETDVEDTRVALQTSVRRWLRVLGTENLPEAEIDPQFRLLFGGTRFHENSEESGSTRTRIVLAFHAAVLEVSLGRGGNHLGLLILDAPRQHELSANDLRSYFDGLRQMVETQERRAQIVIAVSELFMHEKLGDKVWAPKHAFGEALKYLGPVD